MSKLKLRILQATSLQTRSISAARKPGLGMIMVPLKTSRTINFSVFCSDYFRSSWNQKVLTHYKDVSWNREETSTTTTKISKQTKKNRTKERKRKRKKKKKEG